MEIGLSIDLSNRYVLYKAAIDIDLKGFCHIGFFEIADEEGDLVPIRAGKPELFVEIFIPEGSLVDGGPILVFDDDVEWGAAGVFVGYIE